MQEVILLSNEKVGIYSNELEDVGKHGNRWCHTRNEIDITVGS